MEKWLSLAAPLFPPWARLGHPIFRWEIRRAGLTMRRLGFLLWGMALFAAAAALVALYADGQTLGPVYSGAPWLAFLGLQIVARSAAASSTASAVNREVQQGTWETLCTTGLEMRDLLGAKWAAGLWSARWLWAGMLAVRAVLLALLLVDFTRYRGQALTFLADSSRPPIPWVVGLFGIAAGMAASLIQPLVTAGADAAFGIFVSARVRSRAVAHIIAWLGPTVVWLSVMALSAPTTTPSWNAVKTPAGWLGILAFSIEGDMGLGLLAMGWLMQLYGAVDWGFLIGPAALVWLLCQTLITVGWLRLAGWRARRLVDR